MDVPPIAAIIEGIPNLTTTPALAFFAVSVSLNRLLRKCTTAVILIAVSSGKKIAKAGSRIVPNPKPEKKVSPEARKATMQMIR